MKTLYYAINTKEGRKVLDSKLCVLEIRLLLKLHSNSLLLAIIRRFYTNQMLSAIYWCGSKVIFSL